MLALAALRGRDSLLQRNMDILRTNLMAMHDFMEEFGHVFRYRPPVAGSVAFPRCVALPNNTYCKPHITTPVICFKGVL